MGMNYLNPEKHLQFHLKVTGERQFIQMQVTMGWFQSEFRGRSFLGRRESDIRSNITALRALEPSKIASRVRRALHLGLKP